MCGRLRCSGRGTSRSDLDVEEPSGAGEGEDAFGGCSDFGGVFKPAGTNAEFQRAQFGLGGGDDLGCAGGVSAGAGVRGCAVLAGPARASASYSGMAVPATGLVGLVDCDITKLYADSPKININCYACQRDSRVAFAMLTITYGTRPCCHSRLPGRTRADAVQEPANTAGPDLQHILLGPFGRLRF